MFYTIGIASNWGCEQVSLESKSKNDAHTTGEIVQIRVYTMHQQGCNYHRGNGGNCLLAHLP